MAATASCCILKESLNYPEQIQMKNGGKIYMTRHFCLLMLAI
jgi:hypothetical protein